MNRERQEIAAHSRWLLLTRIPHEEVHCPEDDHGGVEVDEDFFEESKWRMGYG
jgi:hypothetical protein